MANATLRDLSEDSSFAESDVIPKQSTDGPLKKITGLKFLNALSSGGDIELSLAADQVAAAGVDTTVQYSNNSVRAGDADLVWDNSGKALTIGASTAAAQVKLPAGERYGNPTLAISEDTGLLEDTDDVIAVTCGGTGSVIVNNDFLRTGYAAARNVTGKTSTKARFLPDWRDDNTGVGTTSVTLDDAVTLIAGSKSFALFRQKSTDEDFVALRVSVTAPRGGMAQALIQDGFPSGLLMSVRESTNDLQFWVRYADGTEIRVGSVSLT